MEEKARFNVKYMEEMKLYTHEEMLDRVIGTKGTPAREKYEIDITVSGAYDLDLINAFENIEVHPRYLPERKRELGNYVRELRSLLLKEKYDVVYVHGSSAIIGIELFIAKMCGCKVRIAHSHSSSCEHKKMDKLIRPIFYRSYTDALACSDAAGKWMYRNRPYEIIKNGRSTEEHS